MGFFILLTLFVLVPVIEISLLIKVGATIGGGTTILVVIFTAFLGAYLVRQQGFATLFKVQEEMNAGRVPAMQMAEGIALLFAGAVLLTPGFLTDAIGFALLTPPIRRALIAWVAKQGFIKAQAGGAGFHAATVNSGRVDRQSGVIEGEYTERD